MRRLKKICLHDGIGEQPKPPIDVYGHIDSIEYLATQPSLSDALERFSMEEILFALDIIEFYNLSTDTAWYTSFVRDINTLLGAKQ